MLNKIPVETIPVTTTTREPLKIVTFDPMTKPPAEIQPHSNLKVVMPAPRVQGTTPVPRVHNDIAPPRGQNGPMTMAKAFIDKPFPTNPQQDTTATQVNLRHR